jgi:carbamoyl-phosphate synthase large subunit
MNILLTCAGRRNYLVQFIKDAQRRRGEVIACDSSETAPALSVADRRVVVPPMDRRDYFDVLITACRQYNVRLLISVNDLELAGLAREAPRFRAGGTIPVVASPPVIALCQDKWETYRFLRSCDIPTPNTYRSLAAAREALAYGKIKFPLLIKPRWGTSAIGVETVENDRELALAHEWGQIQLKRTLLARLTQAEPDGCFVFQEHLHGQEYGIDVVNDLDGRYVATLGRRKLAMRAGNTDRAVTVCDPRLDHVGETIGKRLGHIGSLEADVMVTEHACAVLDLNPRFGGGYAFSHLAGANLPAALIAWASREEPEAAWFEPRPGVLAAKYDGVITLDEAIPPIVTGCNGCAS